MSTQPSSSHESLPEDERGTVPTVEVYDRFLACGIDPAEAFETLQNELDAAGYPEDYPELSKADADAIFAKYLWRWPSEPGHSTKR